MKCLLCIAFLFLVSCKLVPPNVEVCAEINPVQGYCTKTLSDDERMVFGEDWLGLKRNSLVVPNQSYAEIKAFLLKVCKKSDDCDFKKTEQRAIRLENRTDKRLKAYEDSVLR